MVKWKIGKIKFSSNWKRKIWSTNWPTLLCVVVTCLTSWQQWAVTPDSGVTVYSDVTNQTRGRLTWELGYFTLIILKLRVHWQTQASVGITGIWLGCMVGVMRSDRCGCDAVTMWELCPWSEHDHRIVSRASDWVAISELSKAIQCPAPPCLPSPANNGYTTQM